MHAFIHSFVWAEEGGVQTGELVWRLEDTVWGLVFSVYPVGPGESAFNGCTVTLAPTPTNFLSFD